MAPNQWWKARMSAFRVPCGFGIALLLLTARIAAAQSAGQTPSSVPSIDQAQEKSSSSARWSPDGRWVAFSSDRPGQIAETKADSKQIYVIDPTGGEARQVTKLEDGVDGF